MDRQGDVDRPGDQTVTTAVAHFVAQVAGAAAIVLIPAGVAAAGAGFLWR
jgi:hypothetical protein